MTGAGKADLFQCCIDLVMKNAVKDGNFPKEMDNDDIEFRYGFWY